MFWQMKKEVVWQGKPCYNRHVTASNTGDREEVFPVQEVLSFLVSVMAGVACHYIIKWLDRDK